jgi:DNA repair exonuclease SbcCD ATPase subunit
MKRLSICVALGIVILSLSLFMLGCLDVPRGSEVSSNNTPLPVTPPLPSTSTSITTKAIWGGIGFATCLVIILITWYFISSLRGRNEGYYGEDLRYWKNQANEFENNLKRIKNELADIRKKFEKYQSFESQIPSAESQFHHTVAEIGTSYPKLFETDFKELSAEPPKEYWAFVERVRALKLIKLYFQNEENKAQDLKTQCQALLTEIKAEEPQLYTAFEKAISSATVDGINAIYPILTQVKNAAVKQPASTEIKNELESLEKSLENIRDYSYRLIPSRLLKFANELIESPASEKENKLKEKTIREIMSLINQYLRL